MGCHVYTVVTRKGERDIRIVDSEEGIPCLCTFPYNDAIDKKLDGESVISMAYLGATLVMLHQGELMNDCNYIPDCLPKWVRQEIKKHIIT